MSRSTDTLAFIGRCLMAFGAGNFSLDARRARKSSQSTLKQAAGVA